MGVIYFLMSKNVKNSNIWNFVGVVFPKSIILIIIINLIHAGFYLPKFTWLVPCHHQLDVGVPEARMDRCPDLHQLAMAVFCIMMQSLATTVSCTNTLLTEACNFGALVICTKMHQTKIQYELYPLPMTLFCVPHI